MCGHWCHEETLALLMILPFTRMLWVWVRVRWHRAFGKPQCGHEEHTCHEHVDMTITGPPGVMLGNRVVVEGQDKRYAILTAEGDPVVAIGSEGSVDIQAIEVKA